MNRRLRLGMVGGDLAGLRTAYLLFRKIGCVTLEHGRNWSLAGQSYPQLQESLMECIQINGLVLASTLARLVDDLEPGNLS